MIEIRDLTFTYRNESKPALQDITLTVPDGAFTGIIGPAGAGKTSLARALNGMIPHHYTGDYYGSVKVDGQDTVETGLPDLSRLVGMVFQDVDSQIISSVVEDEILYGLENFGVPHEEIPERMDFALEKVGIADLRERTVSSLSGGQRQKVAIASVIALRPGILVLDEPTGELDPVSSRQVFSLLRSLNRDYGTTVVIVEQKIMLLCEFADYLAVLDRGRIVRQGKTRDVLACSTELEDLGVNCPRVTLLSRLLGEQTGKELPVSINLDEAEETVRGLIG